MVRVQRLRHTFVRFEAAPMLDLPALLSGEIDVAYENRAVAINLATGGDHLLTPDEVGLLAEIPECEWTPVDDLIDDAPYRQKALRDLLAKQLLVADNDTSAGADLRRRAERLSDTSWFASAALFHYTSRWNETNHRRELADLEPSGEQHVRGYDDLYRSLFENFGPPPPTFHRPDAAGDALPLPTGRREGVLFRLLERRKTTRGFDRDHPLDRNTLATILHYTYGCQGTAELATGLSVQRKTSPSAGALHPIEVYPLIIRVDGIEPGCYHYDVERHALAPLVNMSEAEAEDLIEVFTARQAYYRSAHVLFVMAARFYRTFWKYRGNSKAYKVLLMDAAHLSQTHYLVCTELGLGAFFTGAVSDVKIEKTLGLDPLEHGVIGVSGCGTLSADQPDGALRTVPFRPRR